MITIELVEHVAKLSRLALSEEEKNKFTAQLDGILEYFNQLNEVNTENIEPMAHPYPAFNIMREDIVAEAFDRDALLKNAPLEEDGFFKVPKINEE